MSAAEHQPLPKPVRRSRWPWLLGGLMLAVYFLTPPRIAYDQTLDNSNFATYSYFLAHHFQWGSGVTPMPGPLGFLIYGNTYSGELYGARYVGDFLLTALFSALLLRLFHRAGPGGVRWAWLAAVVILVPLVDDLLQDFAIVVATLVLISELAPKLNRWSFLAALALGGITLIKGNHPVTTALCFSAVILLCVWERQWRALGKLTAVYVLSFVAFWIIAGQNPGNIPAYLQATLQLSVGYNAVMGLDEPSFLTLAGLGLALGMVLVFAWAALIRPRHARTIIALLVLAGFSFIKWKHGYVRADGHVYIFFTAMAIFTLTICLVTLTQVMGLPQRTLSVGMRRCGLALVTLTTGFAFLGAAEFSLKLAGLLAVKPPGALQRHARYFVRPGMVRAKLEQDLELNRRKAHAPQIQAEVGRESVDFFGNEEGLLLLNNLVYQPRPMGGGTFNVFNGWVQDRNEAFVRDPHRAPRWEVMRLQTIDGRFPAADDGTTLRAILELYTPVLMQRDYLLLRRRSTTPVSPAPEKLETRPITAGVEVTPPAVRNDQMLLFTVHAPLTAAGRMRAFAYRPPELRVHVRSAKRPAGETFVLKPSMLQRPIILSPVLIDNSDVLTLFGSGPYNSAKTLTFITQPGFETHELTVTFYAVPRPQSESQDVQELLTYRRNPLYNRPPLELVTQETGIRELYDEPITLVHAPGSITWDLKAGDQQVIFDFGMMPQSYLDGGNTDGVGFNVEVIWPPKDGRILFKQILRPVGVKEDRGLHRARVFLPPFEPGARLRIRTDTGPGTDGAYDQSFVTRVQIKSGALIPEQFNGLGVVPADGRLPHTAIAAVENRPVFLIHAPSELLLAIPDGATEFRAQIGLLPSAYQAGGKTDGVDFNLEAILPSGGTRALFNRFLKPYTQPADQGPQQLALPLSGLPAGSKLRITTGMGPAHDPSWDQSYITGATFGGNH